MKTKTLLTFVVLFTTMMSWAITPKQVTWDVLTDPVPGSSLAMSASGTLIWGDYNNDGHLDAFMIAGQGSPLVRLYKNNGNETFTRIDPISITALSQAGAVFLDYNNDGNLDLLIAGLNTSNVPQTILYKNSGAPDYTFEVDNANTDILVDVYPEGNDNSTRILEAFDYNNDGWTDVLINGNHGANWVNSSTRVVALYKNNNGTFELQTTPYNGGHFIPMNGGSIHVGDANNDGFDDILVSGYSSGVSTNLYVNNQNGTFDLYPTSTFRGHQQGETLFVDINGDGWNDIVEIGRDVNNGWACFANLYINNQDNTVTKIESSTSNLTGGQATIAAGDVNNDGHTDLMAIGWNTNSKLFYNNGDSTFTTVALPEEARAIQGRLNMVDFNNDNTLDFSSFGKKAYDGTGNTSAWPNVFVKNSLGEGIPVNTPPTKPTNLAYTGSDGQYIVTWDKSTDDITHTDAIRYNLYVKFEDNSVFCLVPADTTTGKLKVNGLKSFLQTDTAKLNLPKGIYTIGIAAVDQAYASSTFATMIINDPPTGLQSETLDNVRVHAENNAILITNNSENTLSCDILSLDGRLINSDVINANSSSSVSIYNKGVYLVKLNGGRNARIDKVIVN